MFHIVPSSVFIQVYKVDEDKVICISNESVMHIYNKVMCILLMLMNISII